MRETKASVTLDKEIMAFGEFKFGFFAFSSLVFISGIIGAVLSGWSLWLLLFVPLSFLGLVSGYFAGGLLLVAALLARISSSRKRNGR